MGNLEDKIMQARDKLQMVQYQLGDKVDPMLIEEEKAASADLRKWLEVQEKVFKQKYKAHWIEQGDGSNSYFFKCMKARASSNSITMLKNAAGRMVYKNAEIEQDITQFYQELLGSAATKLPSIDLTCIRMGPKINIQQQTHMCRLVSQEEIQDRVFRIDNNKTPGIDGYTTSFFKKAWQIVKKDVMEGVKEFFEENKLITEMNTTVVTLVPKR